MDLLEKALHYHNLGFAVIPIHGIVKSHCTCGKASCKKPGKHPRVKWRGRSLDRPTENELKKWWEDFPDSNIGILTGGISEIAVIDVDGQEGIDSMKSIGLPLKELPKTPTVKTGGGGYHLIYKLAKDSDIKTRTGILKKVDIRAEGGLIVAPPSLHISGKRYEWIEGRGIDEVAIATFDFSRLNQKKEVSESKESPSETWYKLALEGTSEGDRNDLATRLAGRYFSLGLSDTEVRFFLVEWNKRNNPPLAFEELTTIIKSIQNKEAGSKLNEEDTLEIISGMLKLKLESVKRITGDESKYILKFEEGQATLSTAQLMSPIGLQQAIAEATKVVVPRRSSKSNPSHAKLVQMIMDISKDQDAGIEATKRGEILALLKDYFQSVHSIVDLDESDEDIPHSGAFKKEGFYWIQLDDLIVQSIRKVGIKTSRQALAQNLRAMGIKRREFHISSSKNIRSVWGISPDKVYLREEVKS